MTSNNKVNRCRLTYEKYFESALKTTNSPNEAVDSVSHYYLDGKPVKKGYTAQVRSTALWRCYFWETLPEPCYSSDPVAFAFGYSLYHGLADPIIFKDLLRRSPNTLKRGIRYSQIFLQPESPSWQQILLISEDANDDFQKFIEVCRQLYAELHSYDELIFDLQKYLTELTIFEFLLYGSLFTFQNFVPDRFDSATTGEKFGELQQNVNDALNELLIWKLKTRSENDLRLNERFLAKSLKQHLIPLLLPGERSPSQCLKNLDLFNKLVAVLIKRNDFLHRIVFEFCLDDDYRYKIEDDHLVIYPIEIPEESTWDLNGRKLTALHVYWFNRAIIQYSQSNLSNQQFGSSQNDEFNRLAYIKACQVYLKLDEVFGLDPEILLSDDTHVDLFISILSLELMTAFFNHSYIAKFQEYMQESGNWINALSQLMLEGISIGENRFPLTWAIPSEKAQRIKSWTASQSHPEGDIKMAEAILDFWTNDMLELSKILKKSPNVPIPEFHEKPIIKLGNYGFQLPWLVASQNNSTATVNNLRRIGSRRKDREEETHRIESRLGDLFKRKGFTVVQSYQPELINGRDSGEVDLLCYKDGHLLLFEIKSTYIRKTKQEAWIHRTTTLRKAAQQLKRKENAIIYALERDPGLLSNLKVPSKKCNIRIYPWIVDSSIEYDQEIIDGYLKISLEGLIVILRNERHLLAENLSRDKQLSEDDMFPDGFSVQTFVKVVEGGQVWSPLKK